MDLIGWAGFILSLLATLIASHVWWMLRRDHKRSHDPVVEIDVSQPLLPNEQLFRFGLTIRNPRGSEVRLQSLRATYPSSLLVYYLPEHQIDVDPAKSIPDLVGPEVQPPDAFVDAGERRRFRFYGYLYERPAGPQRIQLEAAILLGAKTPKPRIKSLLLPLTVRPRKGA